jgi:hypothetical protein
MCYNLFVNKLFLFVYKLFIILFTNICAYLLLVLTTSKVFLSFYYLHISSVETRFVVIYLLVFHINIFELIS